MRMVKLFGGRAGTLGGAYIGGALGLEAGGKVVGKLVGAGANKLTESLSKDKQITDNKKDKFQNNLNSVRKQYGRIPSEILERMGDPNLTDKITAQEALGIPMGAAINSGIFGLTAKPMMGNLLGAQTFYHGTAKENVPKILKEGIDPQYGGIEGGGAWKIKERNELYNKYKNKEISIDDLKKSLLDKKLLIPEEVQSLNKRTISNLEAKMPLMGIGEKIPMDTTDFVSNAKGRSYVATGVPGRLAANWYSLQNDENAQKQLSTMKNHTINSLYPKDKSLLSSIKNGITMPFKALYEGKKYNDFILNRPDSGVIGGVLPQEDFDARFEADPDDVIRMQTGKRTQQKIEPKNLNLNDPTFKQLFNNRTKNFGRYIKAHPGKFFSGVGMLGLNAGLMGNTVYRTGKAINKLVPDSIKNKFKSEDSSST